MYCTVLVVMPLHVQSDIWLNGQNQLPSVMAKLEETYRVLDYLLLDRK